MAPRRYLAGEDLWRCGGIWQAKTCGAAAVSDRKEVPMEAYTGFAEVYDLFMDNVPYEPWSRYIISLLEEHNIPEGLVLDLGCGTGKITRLLSGAGYDMIGVDNSEEMLQQALEQEHENILYLCQDMREFELYGTVAAVVCICDSLNYILEEEELLQVFRLVNNYLDPGGIFIFDLNTLYKYRELLGESTICENRREASFIWENYFVEETGINEYDLTLFIRENSGLYRKYEETHIQRGYELETVIGLIREAGMEFAAVYDAFTREPPRADSERVYVIAREHGKRSGPIT